MSRTFPLVLLLVVLVATSSSASPVYSPRFHAPPGRFAPNELAEIVLVNEGTTDISMGEIWDLRQVDGDGSAFYQWPESEQVIEPGDRRVWRWDQLVNACYGECQNVREGDPAEAGRYEVTASVDGYEEKARFTLGQYFTLGFEARPNIEFKVFVGTQEEIDEMTAEASSEEKQLIVSGLVRKGRGYNHHWDFSMGPHSIELGEVFIEACDASPFYVQRHREEWLGERWCPWDSYVKRVGL